MVATCTNMVLLLLHVFGVHSFCTLTSTIPPTPTTSQPHNIPQQKTHARQEPNEHTPTIFVPSNQPARDELFSRLATNFTCVGWRQTAKCNVDGPAQPNLNKACHHIIATGNSGFCELSNIATNETVRLVFGSGGCSEQSFSCDVFVHRNRLLGVEQVLQGFAETKPKICAQKRGVVMMASDRILLDTLVALRMLRHHNSTLPVEVWFLPEELCLRSQQRLAQIPNINLLPIPAQDVDSWVGDLFGFWLKPYVIANSRFCEVLFLDSDNIVVSDPEFLFDSAEFKETGAVFWKDFWHPNSTFDGWRHKVTNTSHVWSAVGTDFVWEYEHESGQLLVDRQRHLAALLLALYFALNRQFYAREESLWGDKDLYRFAFRRLGHSYFLVPTPPGSVGVITKTFSQSDYAFPHSTRFCGHTMAQHDPNGELLFLHRNFAKLSRPGGLERAWNAWQHALTPEIQVVGNGVVWKLRMFSNRAANLQTTERWVSGEWAHANKQALSCFVFESRHNTTLLREDSVIPFVEQKLLEFANELKGPAHLMKQQSRELGMV